MSYVELYRVKGIHTELYRVMSCDKRVKERRTDSHCEKRNHTELVFSRHSSTNTYTRVGCTDTNTDKFSIPISEEYQKILPDTF